MLEILAFLGYWGHIAVAFLYTILAVWIYHRHGLSNKQQLSLLIALSLTAIWGFFTSFIGYDSIISSVSESIRNLGWLGFLYFLLRSGEGKEQPKSINYIYMSLVFVIILQILVDYFIDYNDLNKNGLSLINYSSYIFRMLFAAGALVAVHNLYTLSASSARWGISLPMAALAALWTYDLNLYTITYLTQSLSYELVTMRGVAMTLLAPIFVMAALRNSELRLRLSRSVAFQSVSLFVIGSYLIAMVLLNTAIEFVGGDYARLAQTSLIFIMTIMALIILPSGKFRAWFKVKIAKNFFQHRYDYRAEWMRFADTIGFAGSENMPFHERVIKAMADILECPSGMLLVPTNGGQLMLQSRWNWSSADVPSNPGTQHMLEFFESSGHIVLMDEARAGTDNRCDPRALPQWLYDEPNAWLVVPLVHFGKLTGVIILAKPRITWSIDWEDMDMLRVVSRQLASYLSEASSQKKLIEGQQFDQFNRRFAFVMHDIKNLVSQLSILARNAEKHADNPEFRRDMVSTLQSSVGKMNELLARLSQHNKVKRNIPERHEVKPIVMNALQQKRLIHPIDSDFESGLWGVFDPVRLETAMTHLIQNAIEATDNEAPITVVGRLQGDRINIQIIDRGCGMSESFISDQLFKPFESSKNGGFGIGAYESMSLIESMGGNLRVESAIGKGTRFIISLPTQVNDNIPNENDGEFPSTTAEGPA